MHRDHDQNCKPATPIILRQGDTLPKVTVTVRDSTGALVDLSQAGTTVAFKLISATGAVIVNYAAATISNASAAQVTYQFLTSDTVNVTPGMYQGVFRITYPDASSQTVPTYPPEAPYISIQLLAA